MIVSVTSSIKATTIGLASCTLALERSFSKAFSGASMKSPVNLSNCQSKSFSFDYAKAMPCPYMKKLTLFNLCPLKPV
jgi:hypothetical protein